jgi:signal transduction histidine kinase
VFFLAVLLAISGYRLAKIRKKRNAELEESNLVKDRFFSIISHDLKNPVKAQTQLLGHLSEHYDEVDDTTKKRQIQALKESGEHLSELLTNLLDWASIESGRMTCKPIRVDLAAVVRKSMKMVQTTADEKQIRIVPQLSENGYAFTDLNFVETILRNLLSNAIKFSHPGGSVEVVTAPDGDRIALSVVDHGVGMTDELKARLFQKKDISTLGTREETGTGLGLIVCQTLAQLSHADLTFDSVVGEGSTFTLHLPTSEAGFKNFGS